MSVELIESLGRNFKANIFLAQQAMENGERVTVLHLGPGRIARDMQRKANELFGQARIIQHSERKLSYLSSLESFQEMIGRGEVIYDPTRFYGRTESLVRLARIIRSSLSTDIDSVGFESRRRAVFIKLNPKCQSRLTYTMKQLADLVGNWRKNTKLDFNLTILVGTSQPPAARMVAVDLLSSHVNLSKRALAKVRNLVKALGVSALFGLGATSMAAAQAVSQPNSTISAKGGAIKSDAAGGVELKGAVNIGDSPIGVALDGTVESNNYWGSAASLFFRDPNIGAVGTIGSIESFDHQDLKRAGGFVEAYTGMLTIGGAIGHQWLDEGEDGTYGRVDLKLYLSPDFRIGAGGEYTPDVNIGRIGAEWRPAFEALPNLSIFADGEFGNDDKESVMLGIRYHFGEAARSLVDRDRKDTLGFDILNNHLAHKKKESGYLR